MLLFSEIDFKLLCEMNSKAKRLCELMKRGIVEFVYKKKSTGEIRKAKGTLKKELIPVEARRKKGRPKKHPDDLVIYYDTEKEGIRSFKDYLLQKIVKSKKPAEKKQKDSSKDKTLNKKPSSKKDVKDNEKEVSSKSK